MTIDEMRKAERLKRIIIIEQHARCYVCGKPFSIDNLPEIAHRIPKHKWILKKYGKEVIHHRKNLRATCSRCNSAVLVDPHKIEGQKLIEEIQGELNE